MDLSVILIAAVILIISLILVYFLLVRGYREPSFEEFKSNSHAMSLLLDNERGKAKDKKEKKKKTDRKDVGVRVRRTTEEHTTKIVEEEHVEYDRGSHTTESSADLQISKQKHSEAVKQKKSKANRNLSETANAEEQENIESHPPEPEPPANRNIRINLGSAAVEAPVVPDAAVTETSESVDADSGKNAKKKKKQKTKRTDADDMDEIMETAKLQPNRISKVTSNGLLSDSNDLEALVEQIIWAEFSEPQLKRIIVHLNDKNTGAVPWQGSAAENIQHIKKQLAEQEEKFSLEKRKLDGEAKKLRDEAAQTKSRLASLEVQYHQLAQQKNNEERALRASYQELLGKHQQEVQDFQRKMFNIQKVAEFSNPHQLHQMREENARLKERVALAEGEKGRFTGELQRLQAEVNSRDTRLRSLEQQTKDFQELQSRHAELEKKLSKVCSVDELTDLKKQLEAKQDEIKALREKLDAANAKKSNPPPAVAAEVPESFTLEMRKLQDQLKEAKDHGKKFESELQELKKSKADLESTLNETRKKFELEASQLRSDSSHAESQRKELERTLNDKNRLQGDLEDMKKRLQTTETIKVKCEESQKALEIELGSLRLENARQKAQLESPDQLLQQLNNDLSSAKQKIQTLESTLAGRDSSLTKLQQEVVGLRNVQSTVVNGSAEGQNVDEILHQKDAEIANLNKELLEQRQKNQELRQKNYKAVEAANQVEKVAQEVAKRATKDIEEKYETEISKQQKLVQELISRTFPSIKIPPQQSHLLWLQEFERIVQKELVNVTVKPKLEDTVIKQQCDRLSEENRDLEGQLAHYKKLLHETNNTLTQLESKVEREQAQWEEKYAQMRMQMDQLTSSKWENAPAADEVKSQLHELHVRLQTEERERLLLAQECDRLRAELSTERETGKDLSSQAVKLRGMLKTGQDSLRCEQEVVGELKEQLKRYQEQNASQHIHEDLEKLKQQLAQRERQLESEIMSNKNLKGKLAAFGVNV